MKELTDSLKKDMVLGAFWSLAGQFGYMGITLIANILLARVLSPSEFGQLGIVLFFIIIARVLSESGLSGALVRNSQATEIDYSTIFIFNLAVSVTLFFLLIACSGYIADFYEDQSLEKLLMASSFVLIINAFQFVQNAKLVKQMRFKQKAIYEFIAITIAATFGIHLALNDFGVWALVAMQLSTALILTVLLWLFEGGHGALVFNKESFKYHYKFGVNTTLASILNGVFDNIYQVLLGKFFSIAQTGLYFQAKKLQDIPVGVINKLTQSVIFSGLAKIQEEKKRFKNTYQRVIRMFTVIVGFICLFLLVFAQEIIVLILGDQWIDGTFFLQILAIVGFFNIQEMFNRILFKIYNQTKCILYLEIFKKCIQLISIAVGLHSNSLGILMYGFLFSSVLSYLINYYYVQKMYPFLGRDIFNIVAKQFFVILSIMFIIDFVGFKSALSNMIIRMCVVILLFVFGSFFLGLVKIREDLLTLKKLV